MIIHMPIHNTLKDNTIIVFVTYNFTLKDKSHKYNIKNKSS